MAATAIPPLIHRDHAVEGLLGPHGGLLADRFDVPAGDAGMVERAVNSSKAPTTPSIIHLGSSAASNGATISTSYPDLFHGCPAEQFGQWMISAASCRAIASTPSRTCSGHPRLGHRARLSPGRRIWSGQARPRGSLIVCGSLETTGFPQPDSRANDPAIAPSLFWSAAILPNRDARAEMLVSRSEAEAARARRLLRTSAGALK